MEGPGDPKESEGDSLSIFAASMPKRRAVLGDLLGQSTLVQVLLVVAGAVAIGISAQVVIPLPFTPVPITGQTFAVLLGAAALGPIRALASSSLYLLLGLVGLPWFAGGTGGIKVVSSPSFGYLLGFLAASLLVGSLASKGLDRSLIGTLAIMIAGNAVIYLFGVGYLAVDLHISIVKAMALGMTPFLVGDLAKAILADILLPGSWRLLARFSGNSQ